jgi:hypothetical protein
MLTPMYKIVNFHYSFCRFSGILNLSDTSVGGLARLSTHPAEFSGLASEPRTPSMPAALVDAGRSDRFHYPFLLAAIGC